MQKPAFEKIAQISIVVDDIDAYVHRYNDEYGIGPWTMFTLGPETLKESHADGKNADFEIRIALCDALNVQMELIQPIAGDTTYSRFLKEHGVGLHHLCLQPKGGFQTIMHDMAGKPCAVPVIGGHDTGGIHFEYLDLTSEIGTVVELMDMPEVVKPMPSIQYPSDK